MAGYDLDPSPFFVNQDTHVRLFNGHYRASNRPIVLKRHEFYLRPDMGDIPELTQTIDVGLVQARVKHPNVCEVLQIRIDLAASDRSYFVDHVLEALEKDLMKDIEERNTAKRPYREGELWGKLRQIASALALAHTKVTFRQGIAHRDIKPGNICLDAEGNCKVCDFGCFFKKKETERANSITGTIAFMSPQQIQVILGKLDRYNAFKGDVFALGMTVHAMSSLIPPQNPWHTDTLAQEAKAKIEVLPYSLGLKELLFSMLSLEEEERVTMQLVLETAENSLARLRPAIIGSRPEERKVELIQSLPWTSHLMAGYDLDPRPFFVNQDTHVRLFNGHYRASNRSIVLKRHEFYLRPDMGDIPELTQTIDAGLVQARVKHPNICKIWEIRIDLAASDSSYFVDHVLEALEKDLMKDIEERNTARRPYREGELWGKLRQIASALAFAHEKVTFRQGIAHRDIKPGNIFLDAEGNCKVGDFGCFFKKKETERAKTTVGTIRYMSPQQRLVFLGELDRYNVFKGDVFALGMTVYAMSSLIPPEDSWPTRRLRQIAKEKIEVLPYSLGLKELLLSMLSLEEEERVTMQLVLETAEKSITPLRPIIQSRPVPIIQSRPEISWTNVVQSALRIYNCYESKTCVYEVPFSAEHGAKVIVKQIECEDEATALRAEAEAKIFQEHPHPGINTCLGCKKEAKPDRGFYVYIFSEPMLRSLFDDIGDRAKVEQFYTEEQLWAFSHSLLDALHYLQTLGVAHRDIKPHNILIDSEGQIKLCGFSFAKHIDLQVTAMHSLLCTDLYWSPKLRQAYMDGEIPKVQHNPFKSDVFSLGLTLVNLTLLALPYPLQQYIDDELDRIDRYSKSWVDLLRTMLRVEEAHRPDFMQLMTPILYADDEELTQVLEIQSPRQLCEKCECDHGSMPCIDFHSTSFQPSPASRASPAWWWEFDKITF